MLCARHGNKDVVEQILEMVHRIRSQSFAVADVVDFKHHHKQITPLMAAAMHGHVSMVELLLKHSANTELRDHTNGWTALHHAARQLQPQVVKTLIDNGAAITAVDRFGRLPLHLVYRPNNGFSDRSIVVAESGAGVRIRLSVK
jgi:ankyrin repeat protein